MLFIKFIIVHRIPNKKNNTFLTEFGIIKQYLVVLRHYHGLVFNEFLKKKNKEYYQTFRIFVIQFLAFDSTIVVIYY